jgi:hypothetical protein
LSVGRFPLPAARAIHLAIASLTAIIPADVGNVLR